MKNYYRKCNNLIDLEIIGFLTYLFIPLLSMPVIAYCLNKKSKYSIILFSLLIAFVSYCFLPPIEWDKARYFELYDIYRNLSFEKVLHKTLTQQPDFIFNLIIYISSKLNISLHYFIFLITFITVYLIFSVYKDYLEKNPIGKNYTIIVNGLFIFSISYLDLFSGVRFTFAASLCFYGFYQGEILKNKKGIYYLILGVMTHFSTFLFLFVYLIMPILNKIKIEKLKILLFFSLAFILIPKSILLDSVKIFGLSGLEVKANSYLGDNDILKTNVDTFSSLFRKFFNTSWVVIISIFFIIKKQKNHSIYYRIVIYLLIFINIFLQVPIVFNRYALFLKLFLVLFLIDNQLKNNNYKLVLILLFNFIIITINQSIIMRYALQSVFSMDIKNLSFLYKFFGENFDYSDIKNKKID